MISHLCPESVLDLDEKDSSIAVFIKFSGKVFMGRCLALHLHTGQRNQVADQADS